MVSMSTGDSSLPLNKERFDFHLSLHLLVSRLNKDKLCLILIRANLFLLRSV